MLFFKRFRSFFQLSFLLFFQCFFVHLFCFCSFCTIADLAFLKLFLQFLPDLFRRFNAVVQFFELTVIQRFNFQQSFRYSRQLIEMFAEDRSCRIVCFFNDRLNFLVDLVGSFF